MSVLQTLSVLVGNGGIPVGSMEGKRILFLSVPSPEFNLLIL